MHSDVTGMGLTQHRDKGPSTRAKPLPALWPRYSTIRERNGLKRNQGLRVKGKLGIPRSTWGPTLGSIRSWARMQGGASDLDYLTGTPPNHHMHFVIWLSNCSGYKKVPGGCDEQTESFTISGNTNSMVQSLSWETGKDWEGAFGPPWKDRVPEQRTKADPSMRGLFILELGTTIAGTKALLLSYFEHTLREPCTWHSLAWPTSSSPKFPWPQRSVREPWWARDYTTLPSPGSKVHAAMGRPKPSSKDPTKLHVRLSTSLCDHIMTGQCLLLNQAHRDQELMCQIFHLFFFIWQILMGIFCALHWVTH